MRNLADYLRKHITGEVLTTRRAREFFSTDGSVFQLMPRMVVYPRNVTDVRKTVRFSWQLAEKGKVLPITARGKGTDQAGGALGQGIILAFPAHMNNVLELDKDSIIVQPGELYATMQKILITHGRFMPPYPSSIEFSTIGGAVANNAAGEKTVKYGATREYTKSLHVVLANGELIETRRLSKRELSRKLGETTFEGEVYRQMDALIADHWEVIEQAKPKVSKNSAGYDLWDIKRKDGSFDLTPLIVGSQGTLGVVTQIKLRTEPYNPSSTLISAYFHDIDGAEKAVLALRKLKPSALEVVDDHLLKFIHENHPHQLQEVISEPFPKIVLLIEFDDRSSTTRKRKLKQAKKMLSTLAYEYSSTSDAHEEALLWKIRRSAAAVIWEGKGNCKALPIIEDGVVPIDRLRDYMDSCYALFKKNRLDIAIWGHAGDANLHMQPFLDLSETADRQKAFRVMDEYYKTVIEMGGSWGEHNDGRLRGIYLEKLYGTEVYDLFKKVKEIFDPYGILNPGAKLGVTRHEQSRMLRHSYDMQQLYENLPSA